MCKNKLTEEKFEELDNFIQNLQYSEGVLISVLHSAQGIFGYLPKEVQLHIARKLKIPASKVNGVVTFYSYFSEEPKGENVINVCMGTACFVRGSEDVLNEFETKLNTKVFRTSADGKYSIDSIRCIGACGLAPVVIINGKVHGRVKKEDVNNLLKECK